MTLDTFCLHNPLYIPPLTPGGSRNNAFNISKGCLFLVETKCQSLKQNLVSYIPEAISQGIKVLIITFNFEKQLEKDRFELS